MKYVAGKTAVAQFDAMLCIKRTNKRHVQLTDINTTIPYIATTGRGAF
jgi:hypothetical protein